MMLQISMDEFVRFKRTNYNINVLRDIIMTSYIKNVQPEDLILEHNYGRTIRVTLKK